MRLSRTTKVFVIGATLLVITLVAIAGAWLWFGAGDAPESFEASESLTDSEVIEDAAAEPIDLDGTWQVALDPATDGGVGYRILEDLPIGGPEEIAGRTTGVSGTIDLAGSTLERADLEVDMTTLDSGNGLRDDIVRDRYLQTDQFPTATISIDQPTPFELPAEAGELVEVSLPVVLTVHGVSQPVLSDAQGQWATRPDGLVIEVTGTIDTTLAAFDVERPDLAGRTAREDVSIEFKLTFVPTP
ncbi:MAG: YceI family protein [Microthrixaceae bacterium]